MSKLTVIFCLVFLLFTQFKQFKGQKKDCDLRKYEKSLVTIFGYIGHRGWKWAEDEKQMTNWCNAVQKDKIYAKKYSVDCLSGMSKTIASVVVYAGDRNARLYCKNKQERSDFIARAKCGNKAAKETSKCYDEVTMLITNMKKLTDNKDKMPTFCCSFFSFKKCALEAWSKSAPTCSEAMVEQMDQAIDKAAIDALNIICSDYDESDKCDRYSTKFDRTKVSLKHKTFFPAMFDIFESL